MKKTIRLTGSFVLLLIASILHIQSSPAFSQTYWNNQGAKIYIGGKGVITGTNTTVVNDSNTIIVNHGKIKVTEMQNQGSVEMKGNTASIIIDGTLILEKGKILLNGNKLVLNNSDTSALSRTNGYLIAEDSLWGKLVWRIGEAPAGWKYVVPFVNDSLVDVGTEFEVAESGEGNDSSFVLFSTYPTDSLNLPFPDSVYHLNVNAVNRFWEVSYSGYTNNPQGTIKLKYANDDLKGNNIVESKIKAQKWNGFEWDSLKGIIDTAGNVLSYNNYNSSSIIALTDSVNQFKLGPGGCIGISTNYDPCKWENGLIESGITVDNPANLTWVNSSDAAIPDSQNVSAVPNAIYSSIWEVGNHIVFGFDDNGCAEQYTSSYLTPSDRIAVVNFHKIGYQQGGFTGTLDSFDLFGSSVAYLGKLNPTGLNAIAVGAWGDKDGSIFPNLGRGAVWILFIDSTGTVISHQKISDTQGGLVSPLADDDRFGASVARLGDLDSDGRLEIAVGAEGGDAVYIISLNSNGTVFKESKIQPSGSSGTYFGRSVTSIGQLGIASHSIAVGTSEGKGVWILFLNSDGTLNSFEKITGDQLGLTGPTYGYFGWSLAFKPIVNFCGVEEKLLKIGTLQNIQKGTYYNVFLTDSGKIQTYSKIEDDIDSLPSEVNINFIGSAIANIGDINKDGINDLIVGRFNERISGWYSGGVALLFLNSQSKLKSKSSYAKLNELTVGMPSIAGIDALGWSVEDMNDYNNDGYREILVGDLGAPSSVQRGSVYIISINYLCPCEPGRKISVRQEIVNLLPKNSYSDTIMYRTEICNTDSLSSVNNVTVQIHLPAGLAFAESDDFYFDTSASRLISDSLTLGALDCDTLEYKTVINTQPNSCYEISSSIAANSTPGDCDVVVSDCVPITIYRCEGSDSINIIACDITATTFANQYNNGSTVFDSIIEIVINGTFTIDTSFTFQNCPNITLAPYAKIIIQNNYSLTISNSILSAACDTMWDGIHIQQQAKLVVQDSSIIQDATVAVLSDSGGTYDISNSTLTLNHWHIAVDTFAGNHTGTIKSTVFSCPDTLLPPYSGGKTESCVMINNVGSITVGASSGSSNTNYFYDALIGIYVAKSSVTIRNNSFGDSANASNISVGVYAEKGGMPPIPGNSILIGGSDVTEVNGQEYSNVFFRCDNAININDFYTVYVWNNYFLNKDTTGTGIVVSNCKIDVVNYFCWAANFCMPTLPNNIIIDNNLIEDGNWGMFLFNNQNPTYVTNNTINLTGEGTLRWGSIIMNFWSVPPPPYHHFYTLVRNNTIDSVYLGAVVWGRGFAVLDSNTVHLTDPGSATLFNAGLAVTYSPNSWVSSNTVIGDYNGDENRQRGISSWASAGSVLKCNDLDTLGKGFSLLYPQNPVSLIRNDFTDIEVSIAIASNGVIGSQGNTATGFAYDNRWFGSFTAHTRTYDSTDGGLSPFWLRPGTNTFPGGFSADVGTGSSAIQTPFDSITATNSFETCPGELESVGPIWPPHNGRLITQDSINYPNDSLTYRWWARYNLYYTLAYNDSLLEDSVLIDFLQDYREHEVPPKLDSVKQDIAAFVSGEFNNTTYNALMSRLNTIAPDNLMEDNLKDYAKRYLEVFKFGATGELIGQIENIAEYCVFYGGPGVLEARAFLIADSLELLNYDWEDGCNMGGGGSKWSNSNEKQPSEKETSYFLFPNLFKGTTTAIVRLNKDEAGFLNLFSAEGKFITQYPLIEGDNQLIVGNGIAPGIYLYKIWVAEQLKLTGKIIKIE